ncbi:MAG: zinc ABC transporter substrate-binding protein [Betaproteobacteria bacterium]|nr:MAG: zinc ABC transporter substrate-binding protein [Betaproteobacteria bacterium]
MKPIIRVLSGLSLAIFAAPSIAALNIFACEQEWAALAQELAGDKASVYSATTALQDVHKVEARPSLIARVRSADLLICSGSELEVGWLPLLLTQSGNAKIQLGSAGYFEASQFVPKLEIPKVVDRALGDVHPSGNPHVHLDPRNIARVAEALTERFVQLDPANTDIYKARGNSFRERWRAALSRWEQQAAPLKGVPVVVYHKDMSYFINWSGMREAGSLEPKPGLPPTPAHLAELVERMKREPAKVVVYSAYNSPRAAEFLSERTKIPSVMLPFTVGGTDRAKDLFGLFDDTIGRLLATVK